MNLFIFDSRLQLIIIFICSQLKSIENRVSPSNCGKRKTSSFIVRGKAAGINEFPFIVLIKLNGNTVCGGAILNQYWIITAAHCFKGREGMLSSYSLHVGTNYLKGGYTYRVSRVVIHPKFSFDTMNSDLSLLRTSRAIKFNNKVASICLPTKKLVEPTGILTVAGWGRLYNGGPPSKNLQKVNLPIISDQKCSNMYTDKRVMVFRSNFCTYLPGYDTCEGDSGGPAFQFQNNRAVLLGIVSFGWECADTHPGAFTQISYFLDWIEANAR